MTGYKKINITLPVALIKELKKRRNVSGIPVSTQIAKRMVRGSK